MALRRLASITLAIGSLVYATSAFPQASAGSPTSTRCATSKTALSPKLIGPSPVDFYPLASRKAGEEGRAVISSTIGANGRVVPGSAAIKKSSGHPQLDEAAMKWIAIARFYSACANGKSVEAQVAVPVSFVLDNGFAAGAPISTVQRAGGVVQPQSTITGDEPSFSATQSTAPPAPKPGGFVVLRGTYYLRDHMGRNVPYSRAVGVTGKDIDQARSNATRFYFNDQNYARTQPQEILACRHSGWFAVLFGKRVLDLSRTIGAYNDAQGFACGYRTREEAIQAAMSAYFRAGGMRGYPSTASYVGFASGTDFVWSGQSGRSITGSTSDRLEPCEVDRPCDYGPGVYWKDY